ncbi:hypothetical protein [Pseudomonas capsici]|uniref:Terminase small subunit n=1 Tax=Pseudomonas capsici TaxID=2810614 RepID=A0ABT3BQT7_9PSED|nr:hypothetical protein [Pseudomonas capsici]MBN6712585.1 hypothetical protein [Pseudomonas capsici]MBN6717678.1 hypothetical protein [Pseudomonas capsici]MBN6723271.1 hypothetical protein [Pseudomonas capsici]MCV4267066.1 hypothetical protein [Pseudomonas capsici]MCV4276310.1 hypothetical protein [Pseudomonas capsici]
MNIKETYRKEYIEAFSHIELAEKIGVSLTLLDSHADLQGWKEEHRLYWFDKSIEQLKVELINGNVSAVKEMLKLAGITRPVGRPKKEDVEKYLNIKAKVDGEFDADIRRMSLVKP